MELKKGAKAVKPGDDTAPVLGSGDFLEDQGYEAPDEARIKFKLANTIALLIEDHGLKQADVVKRTGLQQADVSRIVNGNVGGYSVFRLMTVLRGLGTKVTISIGEPAGGGNDTSHAFSLAL